MPMIAMSPAASSPTPRLITVTAAGSGRSAAPLPAAWPASLRRVPGGGSVAASAATARPRRGRSRSSTSTISPLASSRHAPPRMAALRLGLSQRDLGSVVAGDLVHLLGGASHPLQRTEQALCPASRACAGPAGPAPPTRPPGSTAATAAVPAPASSSSSTSAGANGAGIRSPRSSAPPAGGAAPATARADRQDEILARGAGCRRPRGRTAR